MNFLRFHPRPTDAAAAETAPIDNDAALVGECLSGSQTAWRTLVKKYSRLVMTVPHNAGLSQQDSEEVLQETFADLFKHLDGLHRADRIAGWLSKAAKFNTIKAQKRIIKERRIRFEPHDWNGDLNRIEDQDELLRAIDTLPTTQRIVLRAALTENILPIAEIAKMAGIKPGSVKTTRERGMNGLRKFFGK